MKFKWSERREINDLEKLKNNATRKFAQTDRYELGFM